MKRRCRQFVNSALSICLLGAWVCAAATAEEVGRVNFDRDIKPLLSDRCFSCHGPDQQTREAELDLGNHELVFSHETADGTPLITPGKADGSELFRRIVSEDDDLRMPPVDADRQLSSDQITLLRRWINQGANWEPHWSLSTLQQAPVPTVDNALWPANPIDHFVLARLEKENLAPSPAASRERLLRRVTLDLTGLPPTLEEIDGFLADDSPDAYERVLERLLASPRYGVRMAVPWLDLARYADTSGYQNDRYRDVWPWRDWVVNSLNENMPFDQFVTWQLAGDLLPDATQEQRLATAFNRLHRQNEESGAVPEEFRVEYVADRVITFGTSLLGITLECARCHDHKYDPITQKNFYELSSFFDNIDEAGVNSSETDAMPTPTLLLSTETQQQEIDTLRQQIAAAAQQLAQYESSTSARASFETWQQSTREPVISGKIAEYSFDAIDGEALANTVDSEHPGRAEAWPKMRPGKFGQAILLNGDTRLSFKDVGKFRRADPFSFSLWIKIPKHIDRAIVLHRTRAALDAASRGYELLIEDGKLDFGISHMWPGNALRVVTRDVAPIDEWIHIGLTYDGSSRAAGAKIYVNGEEAVIDVIRDKLAKDILYDHGKIHLTIGERWRDAGFKDGQVDQFAVFDRTLTTLEISQLYDGESLERACATPPREQNAELTEQLWHYFLANHDTTRRELTAQLHALRNTHNDLIESIPELMVMKEMRKPRKTYYLNRGVYDQQGEQVTPDVPDGILPLPSDATKDRLSLARWLFDPQHPLTARVAVNRLWQQMFGQGLVDTPYDFGSQGTAPTHPELLDWLARHYIDSGWDTKALLRTIALSATYRQASQASPKLREQDPTNRLLARGPKHRLSAEMIRDSALAASGLLVEKTGGPPARPYQPEGLWKEKALAGAYEPSTGDDLYRRSLYTIWKRTVPPPSMLAFDAPTRSVCTVARQQTGTPQQALVLMNDVQYVEAARILAERMLREGGKDLSQQITLGFRAVTSRAPTLREVATLVSLYNDQSEWFASRADDANQLLAIGEHPVDKRLNAIHLAAMTTVASTLLNLDEFVTKR